MLVKSPEPPNTTSVRSALPPREEQKADPEEPVQRQTQGFV